MYLQLFSFLFLDFKENWQEQPGFLHSTMLPPWSPDYPWLVSRGSRELSCILDFKQIIRENAENQIMPWRSKWNDRQILSMSSSLASHAGNFPATPQ